MVLALNYVRKLIMSIKPDFAVALLVGSPYLWCMSDLTRLFVENLYKIPHNVNGWTLIQISTTSCISRPGRMQMGDGHNKILKFSMCMSSFQTLSSYRQFKYTLLGCQYKRGQTFFLVHFYSSFKPDL